LPPLNVITSQTVSYHINQLFFSKVKQMGTMKCDHNKWLITWTMITLSGSHCFTTYALLNRFQFMKLLNKWNHWLSFLNLVVVIPLVILHALLSPLLSTRYFFLYYTGGPLLFCRLVRTTTRRSPQRTSSRERTWPTTPSARPSTSKHGNWPV
jgi:hypothetical protein